MTYFSLGDFLLDYPILMVISLFLLLAIKFYKNHKLLIIFAGVALLGSYICFFETLNPIFLSLSKHLKILLFFTLLASPTNTVIQFILEKYNLLGKQKEKKEDLPLSELLGSTERIAIGIFVLMKQFEVIGFIIATKAIIREIKIKDDEKFGVYYFLGTLFSIISVMVVYYLLFC